ncbi:MAG: hypothetical protein MJK10_08705 [Pseudomonadales bacterium]|nr:hypothetical protein [Pseudomonadales bacterium]
MDKIVQLNHIVDLQSHPISENAFRQQCRESLKKDGAVVLEKFLTEQALKSLCDEGEAKKQYAYYTAQKHNIYISDADLEYPLQHIRNKLVVSTKGCLTDDQIGSSSILRILYDSEIFRSYLKSVLEEVELYPYADECSSINLHYASEGQELGWHFDNSSFATTLLIQKPEGGGEFHYVRGVRDAERGEMNFESAAKVVSGAIEPSKLAIEPGDLVLFRGKNAIHCVTPTIGKTTRMLAVLAFNNKPGIALSASARKTFYGR